MGITRPPHLTTQIVLDSAFNYYTRPVRHNGAFTEGIFLPYVFFMAMAGNRRADADPAMKMALRDVLENFPEWTKRLPLKEGASPLRLAADYERWYFDMSTNGDYESMWKNPACSLEEHIADYADIPMCLLTSWYGHHAWSNFEKWRTLREQNSSPTKIVCGIWTHGPAYLMETVAGEVSFGNGRLDQLPRRLPAPLVRPLPERPGDRHRRGRADRRLRHGRRRRSGARGRRARHRPPAEPRRVLAARAGVADCAHRATRALPDGRSQAR